MQISSRSDRQLKGFSYSSATNNEDILVAKIRDINKVIKAELEDEYSQRQLSETHQEKVSFKDQIGLKRNLNKLVSINNEKEKILANLMIEVAKPSDCLQQSQISSKPLFMTAFSESISNHSVISSTSIAPNKDEILDQINRIAQLNEEAEQEQERLQALYNKEKKTNLI